MNILAIIPARMGSSRFPGKPMAKILGRPMIGHVYENVKKCKLLTKVIVATCDTEIAEYIQSINGQAIMTSDQHERASDRCAEALLKLEELDKIKYDIIVMVQGDEPMTQAEMITEAVLPMMTDSTIKVTNLMGQISTSEEFNDRNCIKVVCDTALNAIYFSREPIPTTIRVKNVNRRKQVCVIPFKRDFLIEYTKMAPTDLEIVESIDMLRVLENGYKVRMVPTHHSSFSVDTEQDLKRVEEIMKGVSN